MKKEVSSDNMKKIDFGFKISSVKNKSIRFSYRFSIKNVELSENFIEDRSRGK